MATGLESIRKNVIERLQSSDSDAAQWGTLAAGAFLVGYGLIRGSFLGLLSTAAGAGVLYLGLSGRESRTSSNRSSAEIPQSSVEENLVDEASWESFPASDSPAY